MSRGIALALLVLLVVLGGGALLVYEHGASQRPSELATLGQPLLKHLEAANVAAIAIRDSKGALTIELKNG
nr:hypothetical protein [Betaproteobacteria bacterium]